MLIQKMNEKSPSDDLVKEKVCTASLHTIKIIIMIIINVILMMNICFKKDNEWGKLKRKVEEFVGRRQR